MSTGLQQHAEQPSNGCLHFSCSVSFGALAIGDYFVHMNHLWEKVGPDAGLADGYECSNYFAETQIVSRPQNEKTVPTEGGEIKP